jgi:hypothetical protein
LRLTFKSAFLGVKSIFVSATDQPGLSSGWQGAGTWTIPNAVASATITPSSGSGISQTFSVAVSDPNGATDIASIYILINAQLTGTNACQVAFDRASGLLWLVADNGTTWLTAGVTGSGATVSNSQCSLDPINSSLSTSGASLNLNLKLIFKPAFSAANKVFVLASNQAGLSSSWQQVGTWTY